MEHAAANNTIKIQMLYWNKDCYYNWQTANILRNCVLFSTAVRYYDQ